MLFLLMISKMKVVAMPEVYLFDLSLEKAIYDIMRKSVTCRREGVRQLERRI